MRLTDAIAAYILHMLELADDGEAELRRNELAEELGCVPSQINYVLTSRFTPEQGYIVESKRGGGGYIRIRRVKLGRGVSPLMHIVNTVGNELNSVTAQAIVENLMDQNLISESAARVMLSALSDQAYRDISIELRDRLRASLLKQMLTALIT
jgi:transcriptional regulator CtsR